MELQVRRLEDGTSELRLIVTDWLDHERVSSYNGLLLAVDGGHPQRSGSMVLTVDVGDSNDNAPIFKSDLYTVTVSEDFPIDSALVQVQATDADDGDNGRVVYRLAQQTAAAFGDTFAVESNTGEVLLGKELDYEKIAQYMLLVTASDGGLASMVVYTRVVVTVIDVNDHRPSIRFNAVEEVPENKAGGLFVAQFSVDDADSGDNGLVDCQLASEDDDELSDNDDDDDDGDLSASISDVDDRSRSSDFEVIRLYPTVYKIVSRSTFDREIRSSYRLAVVCRDRGQQSQKVVQEIIVDVSDENDMAPEFDAGPNYGVTVSEDISPGTVFLNVSARDGDAGGRNSEIVYEIVDNFGHLVAIESSTGSLSTVGAFDYEIQSTLEFRVVARDRGDPTLSTTATVTVTILDANDEAPVFLMASYTFGSFENQPPGTEIGQVSAVDGDSAPFNNFRFSLRDLAFQRPSATDAFRIDPVTGLISTTRSLDRELHPVYRMSVIAVDVAFPFHASTGNVTVIVADRNDNAPMVDYPTPDDRAVHVTDLLPVGQVIARIAARDADLGDNARLEYLIAKGNEERRFNIDTVTGEVSLSAAFVGTTPGQPPSTTSNYRLVIIVKDLGKPEKSAMAVLEILVNHSLKGQSLFGDLVSENGFGFGLETNLQKLVVAILGGASTCLLVVLVVIVVCLRQRRTTSGSVDLRKSSERCRSSKRDAIYRPDVTVVVDSPRRKKRPERLPVTAPTNPNPQETVVQTCTDGRAAVSLARPQQFDFGRSSATSSNDFRFSRELGSSTYRTFQVRQGF